MSKPTQKQKIKRNLILIFNASETLARKYPAYEIAFYRVESQCHFVLLHHFPYETIEFDKSIEQLEAMVYSHKHDRFLQHYYERLVKTNSLLRKLSKKY